MNALGLFLVAMGGVVIGAGITASFIAYRVRRMLRNFAPSQENLVSEIRSELEAYTRKADEVGGSVTRQRGW